MTNIQRMRNDLETIDKREMADKTTSDNRNRNDALTQERRFNADKTMDKNRLKNDELTAIRREIKDENPGIALAIFLGMLVVLAIEVYFISM